MEKQITIEDAYFTQNYLVGMCVQYRDRLAELERDYHKMRSQNWQHKCKQLKSANRNLHSDMDYLNGMLHRCREDNRRLRGEVRELRNKLERYQQLEEILDSMGGGR